MDKKTSHTLAKFGFIFARVYILSNGFKKHGGIAKKKLPGLCNCRAFSKMWRDAKLPTVLAVLRPTLMTPKKSIFQVFIFCVFGWGSSETLFGVVWFWDFVWGGGSFEALFGVGVVLRPKTRQKHLQKLHKWLQCYLETNALPLVSKSARKMPVLVSGYIKLPPSKL